MKFSGIVGFLEDEVETKPDVYEAVIVEKKYFGDILQNNRRFQTVSNQVNDNLTTSNRISILSDLYLRNNWSSVRYVIWNGVKWAVTNVSVDYPRITLELGGVWNGETENRTEENLSRDPRK